MIGLVSCSPRRAALPSDGGPVWFEVHSDHFTLWTDAGTTRAHELLRDLEVRLQVISRAMGRVALNERTFVVALHSSWEAAAYLPKRVGAMAVLGAAPFDSTLVISADDAHVQISHVLAYVISRSVVRHQPAWLAEGIATYFETADLEKGKSSVTVGMPHADRLRVLRNRRTMSVRELFACDFRQPCHDERFVATAWAMFSYLVNERVDALAEYLRRLDDRIEPQRAWSEAFAGVSLDEIERGLTRWMGNGDVRLPRIAVSLEPAPSATRMLGDADVLAARGMLEFAIKDNTVGAQSAAETALLTDPTNVLAHLILFVLRKELAPEEARAIAAAHPEDWRAWWMVAKVVPHTPEAVQAHDRICTLSPTQPQICMPM